MNFLNIVLNRYNLEKTTKIKKWFAKSMVYFKADVKKGGEDGILLVQMVKTYDYAIKLAAASRALAKKNNLIVNLYAVDVNWSWKEGKLYALFDALGINSVKKIYLPFGNKIAFSNNDKFKDQQFIKSKLNEITEQLASTDIDGLLSLKFDNVLVGDLIYDSYLRFFHKPTIEEIDENVIYAIELALNLFYNFSHFIKNNNIKCLLNTYVAYIQHGIPARICLKNNIDVYTLGSASYIIQKMTNDFPYHQINHTVFDPLKKLTQDQIELAKNRLESRFGGKIDTATSYMRKSAYTNSQISSDLKEKFEQQPRNVVIYVHDFYDSPHINRLLQFPDLYEFLKQTLATLANLDDTSVFIKVHPNGIDGAKEKAVDLINSFNKPYFHILDESVSNLNIVDLKPDLIGTARGTIGIEMAYFGIPVVALFDNLYANFSFAHTCMDKETYFSILCGNEKPLIDFNRESIFSFYYQAFLEKTPNHDNNIFSVFASYKDEFYSDDFLNYLYSSDYDNQKKELVRCYSEALKV